MSPSWPAWCGRRSRERGRRHGGRPRLGSPSVLPLATSVTSSSSLDLGVTTAERSPVVDPKSIREMTRPGCWSTFEPKSSRRLSSIRANAAHMQTHANLAGREDGGAPKASSAFSFLCLIHHTLRVFSSSPNHTLIPHSSAKPQGA